MFGIFQCAEAFLVTLGFEWAESLGVDPDTHEFTTPNPQQIDR